jgi:cyclopropane-fatty-acyl-phospholipid synthase
MTRVHNAGRISYTETPPDQRCVSRARAILHDLFGPPEQRAFTIRLWDGTVEAPPAGHDSRFTLIIRRPGALRRMLLPPTELALGEAYLRDDYDIAGNVEAATALAPVIVERLKSPTTVARLLARLRQLPTDDLPAEQLRIEGRSSKVRGRSHSRSRDAAAIRSHYDVGNDFYALWLDQRMVYSCAYFETKPTDLGTAQAAKLDLICHKLRLQPGERLLDIGSGWGGLIIHAAQHYGVEAMGITLSEEQARFARNRIAELGLSDRCRVEVRDYRAFPKDTTFDKVVSVGMFEHVGRAKLPGYFATAYRLTKPGGLFLNHGIVTLAALHPLLRPIAEAVYRRTGFIPRYVFPDGELVAPGEVTQFAEAAGFETRDLESLREHYVLTLRHWVQRLEAHHDEAAALVGEKTYRVWRLYMAGCAHAFATGRVGIVQVLLSKPDAQGRTHLPLTRDDIHRPMA